MDAEYQPPLVYAVWDPTKIAKVCCVLRKRKTKLCNLMGGGVSPLYFHLPAFWGASNPDLRPTVPSYRRALSGLNSIKLSESFLISLSLCSCSVVKLLSATVAVQSRADAIFIACCVHLNVHLNIIKQEITCTVSLVMETEYQQRRNEDEEGAHALIRLIAVSLNLVHHWN